MHCSARRLLSTCATPLCEAWATRQIGSTGVVSAPLRSHNESSVARVTHLEECSPTGERNRTTKRAVIDCLGFAGAPIHPALCNLNTWNGCVTRLTEVVSGGTTRSYTGSARCR